MRKKEHVINHIKKVKLPYTIIDIGYWYQLMLPRLPSGRIDYALPLTLGGIVGDGNTPVPLQICRILEDGSLALSLILGP